MSAASPDGRGNDVVDRLLAGTKGKTNGDAMPAVWWICPRRDQVS